MRVIALSSFAKTKRGGNPAGVCLFADALSDAAMRRIAKGVGFSETAFVKPSNRADFKVQFFTPEGEVDLCGHATIATYILLAERGLVKRGKYTQETKAGILGWARGIVESCRGTS
jgi:PhzF family phenazine biosynthesis protein